MELLPRCINSFLCGIYPVRWTKTFLFFWSHRSVSNACLLWRLQFSFRRTELCQEHGLLSVTCCCRCWESLLHGHVYIFTLPCLAVPLLILKPLLNPHNIFNYRSYGHCPSSCLSFKHDASETEFCLRLQVKPSQLGLIDRVSLSPDTWRRGQNPVLETSCF
jgi:hypothetical protein